MSVIVGSLGFPRIGPRRELKTALESHWSGRTDADALLKDAAALRAAAWARQHGLGVTHIPSNDFSLYDHVLDTSVMVGAIPPAYGWQGGEVPQHWTGLSGILCQGSGVGISQPVSLTEIHAWTRR